MNRPKISIIVPIYNVENYLTRCMNSLLNQTINDIEIIMVDDESPDNCPEICDNYAKQDSRIKVIHKKNGGLGLARNSGLEIATGEYVAFVDSDDYVSTSVFEEAYNKSKEYQLDALYFNFSEVKTNGDIHKFMEFKESVILSDKPGIEDFLFNMVGSPPSYVNDRKYNMSVWHALYKLDLIKQNHVIFRSEREMISEDLIFHIQFLPLANKIGFIPTEGYFYCQNMTSLSKSFRKDRFERYKILHKEMTKLLSAFYPQEKWQNSIDRCVMGFTRKNIFRIIKSGAPLKEKIKHIRLVSNDEYFQNILKRYPISQLPAKHKIIALFLKYSF